MGEDKGAIRWHGQEQRYFMADLLMPFSNEVFISCRSEQEADMDGGYQTLVDAYKGMGPVGGILTAFEHRPGSAWLVTACDLPLLDLRTLQYLIDHRDPSSVATTYQSPHDGMPEPLITIWEPAARPLLLEFLDRGITCPRKVLLNSRTHIIKAPYPEALLNANTPADAQQVRDILQQRSPVPHAS